MKKKNISQYKLIHTYEISPSQITRLKRNESVSTNTINIFCNILDCDIADIMEFTKDKQFPSISNEPENRPCGSVPVAQSLWLI